MKILFFGRGFIGTQYAWALENAGHTVEFYVREGRKAQYGSHVNLEILDTRRSKNDILVKEKWPIVMHEEIKKNHDYDLIFVSLNAEQVPGAVKYLAPRVGNATVLFMGNFWRDIRKSVEPVPLSQVVWGAPGCGGGYEGNNLYGVMYKTVHFGVFASEQSQRDLAVHNLFIGADFKVTVAKDFQSWLRNHYALNAAMEAEVLKTGSFKEVASSRKALDGIGDTLREIIPVIKAKGSKIDVSTRVFGFLPPKVVGLLMSVVFSPKGMPYAAMKHNHYKVGAAVLEIIAEAKKYGIKTPRLCSVESLITK